MESEAPGGLEVVRRFVNTLDVETGTDELEPAWLVDAGLLAGGDDVDLDALRGVREALRVVLVGHHVGEPPDAATAAALNAAADGAPLVVRVGTDGSVRLEPSGAGTAAVVGRLLAAVQVATADGSWDRLKACRLDSCQWAFWDASKNRSRSWCSMAVCGNRAKASAYRARRREHQR